MCTKTYRAIILFMIKSYLKTNETVRIDEQKNTIHVIIILQIGKKKLHIQSEKEQTD